MSQRLSDGTVQVIVRDGKIMVVGLDLGGGEMQFPDEENHDFYFQITTLMAGMEYVLRVNGHAEPQSLDFEDDDFYGKKEAEEILRRSQERRAAASYEPFPATPSGI